MSSQKRGWVIGGVILVIVLLCIGCFLVMTLQYTSTISAYAWVQNANDGKVGQPSDLVCQNSQAEAFGRIFQQRYGNSIKITISSFEETDDNTVFEGRIELGEDRLDYEARYYFGEEKGGFLGLINCVEKIELSKPSTLPVNHWGG